MFSPISPRETQAMGREGDNHEDPPEPSNQETISFADLHKGGEPHRLVGGGAALLLGDPSKGAQVFPLVRNPTVLGRSNNADLVLSDPAISDYHARVIRHAFGYTVEDMGSAEGTFLGERRINHARLVNGDTLRLGSTLLTFVDEVASAPKGSPKIKTMALVPTRRGMQALSSRQTVLRAPYSGSNRVPDFQSRGVNEPARKNISESGEAEPSLEDVLRKIVVAARYLRRHAVLILAFSGIGLALGSASFKFLPPVQAARCTLTLYPAPRQNPIDPESQQRAQSDEMAFFAGAERTLVSQESIQGTLERMTVPPPGGADAIRLAKRIRVDSVGSNTYAVSMTPKLFDHRDDWHVRFLEAHTKNYVETEIEKKLKVFVAEVDFLRSQTDAAEKRVKEISQEAVRFREAHADQILAQSALASSPAELELRRIALTGQISRLSGELDGIRSQLNRGSALSQARSQSRQSDREAVASLDRKLAELRAQGFADGHPEIEKLLSERRALNRSIEDHLQADVTKFEKQSNAAYDTLQGQADQLQAQLRAARSELGFIESNRRSLRSVNSETPKVNARLDELLRMKEDAARQHGLLFDRLQKAEVQLRLERVSASTRYEIPLPARLDYPPGRKAFLLRVGIGLGIGVLLAALVLAIAGLKRVLIRVAQETSYAPMVLAMLGVLGLGCAHDGKYVWVTDLPAKNSDSDRIIHPRDSILIEVQKQPTLSGEFTVREDGHYSQPMGGSIYVAGKTTGEVASLVETALREVVVSPVVSVWISKSMPIKISVVGEVKTPGAYELVRDRSLLTGLALAGWLTEFAHADRIFVVRAGAAERIRFRVQDITNAEIHTARFQLADADVVIVE
jgi:polysaccharide biosynthesis/export protein